MKESSGKMTYPGRKQIFRRYEQSGQIVGDRLGLTMEGAVAHEEPLLQRVMRHGQRLSPSESLDAIALRTAATVAALPASVRRLQHPEPLTVNISHGLHQLTQHTRKQTS